MAEIQHPYNEAEIARVRRQLEMATKSNNPQAFEINVDGYRLVHRTTNLEHFDEGLAMLPEEFDVVEIKIFYGGANMNDNHQFLPNWEPQPQQQAQQPQVAPQVQPPLSGMQYPQQPGAPQNLDWVDARVKQSIEAERAKWNVEQLEKENASLKSQIDQKDDYIAKLEIALLEAGKKFDWNKLEGVLSSGLKVVSSIVTKKQGGENLSGMQQSQPQEQPQADNDAAFEEEEEVSDFEKHLRGLIEQVNKTFNAFEAKVFIDLLEEGVLNAAILPEVLKFLRARVYQKRNPHRRHRRNRPYQQQQHQPFSVTHQQQQPGDPDQEEEEDYQDENENH